MWRISLAMVLAILAVEHMFGQTLGTPATIQSNAPEQLPPFATVQREEILAVPSTPRHDFLRQLTIESFGISAGPVGLGYEHPGNLTPGPFTPQGLDCPHCIIRPTMDRTRYLLPAFGAQIMLSGLQDRLQLFTQFGGINSWKPDNTNIQFFGIPGRVTTSYNDAWLLQSTVGGNVAVDSARHVRLGVLERYVGNLGVLGKKRWNTFGGSATFQFGH